MELADRLPRLWAALIDRLLVTPIIVAGSVAVAFRARDNSPAGLAVIAAVVLLFLGLAGYQIWLLSTAGQTIGKRLLGLRVVQVKDLSNGGFVVNVLMRAAVPWVITMIPGLGVLFALLDPLFIFREDRRCVHDHIAGTCVIKA